MKKFILASLFLVLVSCTDEVSSTRALKNLGFTDIRFTGYATFACSEDDDYHTGFVAKNPQGLEVTGVVCCGILKSCTVRF